MAAPMAAPRAPMMFHGKWSVAALGNSNRAPSPRSPPCARASRPTQTASTPPPLLALPLPASSAEAFAAVARLLFEGSERRRCTMRPGANMGRAYPAVSYWELRRWTVSRAKLPTANASPAANFSSGAAAGSIISASSPAAMAKEPSPWGPSARPSSAAAAAADRSGAVAWWSPGPPFWWSPPPTAVSAGLKKGWALMALAPRAPSRSAGLRVRKADTSEAHAIDMVGGIRSGANRRRWKSFCRSFVYQGGRPVSIS
mmetsp:Transcript_41280/g.92983  ORF Transcript_41280/g.92983 Transcript_41280/m.92983 type:complete len:257 (-) Transcript_41280:633-1403(-)